MDEFHTDRISVVVMDGLHPTSREQEFKNWIQDVLVPSYVSNARNTIVVYVMPWKERFLHMQSVIAKGRQHYKYACDVPFCADEGRAERVVVRTNWGCIETMLGHEHIPNKDDDRMAPDDQCEFKRPLLVFTCHGRARPEGVTKPDESNQCGLCGNGDKILLQTIPREALKLNDVAERNLCVTQRAALDVLNHNVQAVVMGPYNRVPYVVLCAHNKPPCGVSTVVDLVKRRIRDESIPVRVYVIECG